MKTNYHTHTKRCGHAFGEDEDYIVAVLANHFEEIGFTDHAFIPGLENDRYMRGPYSQIEEYFASLRKVQKKYANQIPIWVGFEAEYFPQIEDYLRSLLTTQKVDYLILGNHFKTYTNNGGGFRDYFGAVTDPDDVKAYGELAAQALKTGLFTYFAHPDLYMAAYPQWDAAAQQTAHLICQVAKANGIPLEINQGGIRFRGKIPIGNEVRYRYPYGPFWQIAKSYENQIIVGVDAHAPSDFAHEANQIAQQLIDEWGLRHLLIDRLVISPLKKQK